jgi:FKBP-type peptidyl-prolyl cis-trans isomerase
LTSKNHDRYSQNIFYLKATNMRKFISTVFLATAVFVSACGGAADEPQETRAIPENPADIAIAGIESVEIAPGLSSRTLIEGDGAVAEVGHFASVHYTGWLYDPAAEKFRGSKFDSSVDRGAHFRFTLGEGRVIKGWDQGVVGMRVGEVRELTIAPEMGYGARGAPGAIPPNATLVFIVELAGLEGLEEESQP